MARTVDIALRATLVESVATALIEAGTTRLSLREVADHVGTSARMLVHHFGSRDQMLVDALECARARQLAAARSAFAPQPDATIALASVWAWFERADTRQYFALFTEIASIERVQPRDERHFAERLSTEWRPLLEAVFEADERLAPRARELALLVIGTLRGFALDVHDTDMGAHGRAFATLVELIRDSAR